LNVQLQPPASGSNACGSAQRIAQAVPRQA